MSALQATAGGPVAVTGRRPDLPALTGLRIFGALGVFLLHSLMLADPLKPSVPMSFFADRGIAVPVAHLVGKAGFIGVSFFFVLSGFVLCWSARPVLDRRAFIRRRLVKIFPNHVALWIVTMLLVPAVAGFWRPLANLLLIHAWFDDPKTFISVNSPAWSLCCELLFYLSFPFLIGPVRRIAEHRLWYWAAAMIAGMAGIALINNFAVPDHPRSALLPMAVPQQWFGYIFPAPRLFEFVLGMILARILIAGRWPRIRLWQAGLLAAAGYVATLYVPSPFDFILAMIVPVAVLIPTAAAADLAGGARWLRSRPMVWLGKVSFAFYLCQGVVLFQGRLWLGGDRTYSTPVAFGLWLTLFAATLLVGWLLFIGVEEPMMRRFSRRRPRTTPPVPAEPAEPVTRAPVTKELAAKEPAVKEPEVAEPAAKEPQEQVTPAVAG
ncbi:acyltransferase family protein [Dactylosporangium sp. CA-092794]|uniref:acyltransferase family protein n=1 Tax=Dactylosporangium sp. CA-092794 TaxID=3239929 RepID=UPI003D9429FC